MFKNPSFVLEESLIRNLNGKTYDELSNNFTTIIRHLFGYVEPTTLKEVWEGYFLNKLL